MRRFDAVSRRRGRCGVVLRPSACVALALLLAGASAAPGRAVSPRAAMAAAGRELEPGIPVPPLDRYVRRRWTGDHGLPHNSVTAILQTRDGHVWLGTFGGLVRFDGVRFTVYDRRAVPALATNAVRALVEDATGGLWIGTDGAGVLHYRDGVFRAITSRDGLPSDHVRALARGRDGRIWAGTSEHGLAAITPGGGVRVYRAADGLVDDYVLALAVDADGGVWVGTRGGLSVLRRDGWRTYTTRDGLPADYVTALAPARSGGVWIGTGDGAVTRFAGGRLVRQPGAAERPARSHAVYALLEDAGGRLWIGTNGSGLARFDGERVERLVVEGEASADLVWALAGDRDGGLWVGMNGGGLARLHAPRVVTIGAREGLPSDVALALLEDRTGALWVTTAGRGVARIHDDGTVDTFTTRDGLPRDLMTAIAEDSAGTLWFGVGDAAPVVRFDGRRFAPAAGDSTDLRHVGAIHATARGELWIAHRGAGLRRLLPAPGRLYGVRDGLASGFVQVVADDGAGGLWLGTRQGLSRLGGGAFRNYAEADGLPDRNVSAVCADSGGVVWVGTANGGIARLRDGRLRAITTEHGLHADGIHAIVDDGLGALWFSSDRGIFRVAKEELHAVADGRAERVHPLVLDRADGMRSLEANGGAQPAAVRRRDGTLWFSTMAGVVGVDPLDFAEHRAPPPPVIERVVAGDTSFPAAARLELPLGVRTVDVEFAALGFRAPEQVRFRYRLVGVDDDWVDAGTRREARYTNLAPGDYRFELVAADADGPWSAAPAVMQVAVPARLAERWHLRVAGVLALLGLGVWAARESTRRLRQRNAELSALVLERTRAEARYRDLFENAIDAVFTTDRAGRFTAVNRRMEELSGYAGAELLGSDVAAVFTAEGPGGALEPGRGLQRVSLRRKDGQRVSMEITVREIGLEGLAPGLQAIARDVTERTALEEQLRQAQRMEAVGRLAGGVAHDFNNILTAIASCSELALADLGEGHPARADLEEIRRASDRAAALTRQLLAFSRRQVLQPQVLDLGRVACQMEAMLGRIIGEDVTLAVAAPEEPWPVLADPGQIEQVILNLVVNARDAMPQGGTLRVAVRNVAPGSAELARFGVAAGAGRHVLLEVSDTGTGMDAETQARIFEPFFTTKPVGEGTGLGLATVYGIVKQSNGHIAVASAVGRGTTVGVLLPCTAAALPAAPEAPQPAEVPSGGTILLVEDDAAVRDVGARVLRRAGYRVLAAANGPDALALLAGHAGEVRLVVTDVVMPVMSGREFAERARALAPDVPVLLMSGYTEDEIIRRGELPSRTAFIEKPFTVASFLAAVRDVLDGGELAGV